jgi:hypothetical protein
MKQAAAPAGFARRLLLPVSRINTAATDDRVVTYVQLQRFNSASWDDVVAKFSFAAILTRCHAGAACRAEPGNPRFRVRVFPLLRN